MSIPDVSFIVPILNEERYLDATLRSLSAQELGTLRAEVLVLDGGSTDGSAAIVERFASQRDGNVSFRLIPNPRKRTPAAFNIGITAAAAEVIGLGGAHTIYPATYFRTAVELLRGGTAEVVGGGHDAHIPSVSSTVGRAMACLYLSPVGSGVASYHRRKSAGFVDTVYGGFYKRSVFDRIGLFDETLTRNQDNELNARVLCAGFRIYFDPRLSTQYVMKAELPTFLRRGYLFGRFHAETWRRTPNAFRVRHAIPGILVLYLLTAVVSGVVLRSWLPLVPLVIYFLALLVGAVSLARTKPLGVAFLTVPLFAAYHLAYGTGTVVGVLRESVKGTPSRAGINRDPVASR